MEYIQIYMPLFVTACMLNLVNSETNTWDKDNLHPQPEVHNDYNTPSHMKDKVDWYSHDHKRINDAIWQMHKIVDLHKPAKNVIFFMGDGLDITTMTAARIYNAQQKGLYGDNAQLSWEKMHHAAFSKVYSADYQTPDSAATATAMLCGEKTINSALGVNSNVIKDNCSTQFGNEVKSILHHSIEEGKWTGIVSTTRITHASPASTYAHTVQRDWESNADLPEDMNGGCVDIAAQLIDDPLNQQIRVILGGGRQSFMMNNVTDPENSELMGERTDRDLIQEWKNQKKMFGLSDSEYKYVDGKSNFNNVDETKIQFLMGLFEHSHMQYEADRKRDVFGEPSLSEMVEKSIKILRRSPYGYFLFVEAGRIDHAHHANLAQKALIDTVALSDAVEKATAMTNEQDTLIVVTADHSHVLTMAGYAEIDADILTFGEDPSMTSLDGKPFATLSYSNGPGFQVHRMNGTIEQPRRNLTESKDEMTDLEYVSDAGVWRQSETHGGQDVAIFARGPMAHLFHGTQEQTYIGNLMMYASCVGKNKDLCNVPVLPICAFPSRNTASSQSVLNVILLLIILWSIIQ